MAGSSKLARCVRAVAKALVAASAGLWLAVMIYNGCGQGTAIDRPCIADRAPLLAHPLLLPLAFGAAGLLVWTVVEAAVQRRHR